MTQPQLQPHQSQPALPPFTKIRLGGMSAGLEGYAYQIDTSGERPRAVLWYVSMVGHKTAVQAIWAGLVNTPPQSVVLYCESESSGLEEEEGDAHSADEAGSAEAIRKPILVQCAEGQRSGGWHFARSQLSAAPAGY